MSGADVAGLISAINSKDNDNFFGDGIWGIIMLLIVAGIFTGGWGGFGASTVAAAGLTRAELDSEFTQRDIFNTNTSVLTSASDTQKEVLTNRYENSLGVANLQKDILVGNQVMQNQLASCCCDIKSSILEDGEKTRALINANYQASLLEKINDLKAQVSNNEQTGYILNTMGRWHAYPSCACGYGTCNSYNNLV